MYIRMIEGEDFGDMDHGLSESQAQSVQNLKDALVGGLAGDEELDLQFHALLKELFFWQESYKLI